ncbi:GMP synthase (glutamine-hydrolyzing) [Psittacicella melopsittaci]|uniref:GMP synthase [glutamine-hydrolyzing] n=1 Tax=Psittacicella melopsittaci TaxID=2028576 RepID=A0A3A1XZF8_9GAMM|nr:glutamine-hydrolyzing GMP synthase [Psittacicella melopsittaci]RIY31412.1 GMP synthase (glutamine-hydrolyzing) [Psittacicella melopsittaci]
MQSNIYNDKILILDFGSQYTQLIARRIREIGVYCELVSWDIDEQFIRDFNPKGIILSGGPESTTEENSPRAPQVVFELGVPVFGICYGLQTMMVQFGGVVSSSDTREFGYAKVDVVGDTRLLAGLNDHLDSKQQALDVWMSHGDKVTELAPNFNVVAKTDSCPLCVVEHVEKPFFGVQFHPEVTHTKSGLDIIKNFVFKICQCASEWTPKNIIETTVAQIKEQVGNDKVILGLSGGVDSSVAALLIHKAIGQNLHCIFIDNGLLRLNEGDQVMEMFAGKFNLNIKRVNAEDRFLSALAGVDEPEAKRKIIGKVFVEIFDEESHKIEDAKWLGQGTIYPDVIESAASKTGKAHVIKSHHNVGGLPEDMKLGLVEPLNQLFKDEVRRIGVELGLPAEMLNRHPFPGPGLGVRVLGEVKKEYCDILRKADAIFIEELHKANLYYEVSQAFAVFLPVKSVGVMGDGRKYSWVLSLRAVQTIDFMTAHWAHLPYDFLGLVSNRIINEIDNVSRVVYDVSGKPPSTIEWE